MIKSPRINGVMLTDHLGSVNPSKSKTTKKWLAPRSIKPSQMTSHSLPAKSSNCSFPDMPSLVEQ